MQNQGQTGLGPPEVEGYAIYLPISVMHTFVSSSSPLLSFIFIAQVVC
jgi:hypothetical protein